MLILGVLALLLLAGCASKPAATTSAPTAAATSAAASATHASVPRQPVTKILSLSTDGNLATAAAGCVFPAGVCEFHSMGEENASFAMNGTGNLTALSVTVTWQAPTPATDTLALAAYLMCASCDGTPPTFLGGAEGSSPLTLTLAPKEGRLDATTVLHFFVYNSRGTIYNDQVPAYGYATVDQAFHFEAQATVVA
jgi:hypothetical protein